MAIAQTLLNIDHKLDDIERHVRSLNLPAKSEASLVAELYSLWEKIEAAAEQSGEKEAA